MSALHLGRQPTCLSCLRSLTRTPAGTSAAAPPPPISHVQTRGKSSSMRPRDQGAIVRLLVDIPKFGRKDSIMRVQRGRMRNIWFPTKQAEYMTPLRFEQLGLTRNDIAERDIDFVIAPPAPPPPPTLQPEQVAETTAGGQEFWLRDKPVKSPWKWLNQKEKVIPLASVFYKPLSPEKTRHYLDTLVPKTLKFTRRVISSPLMPASPLVGAAATPDLNAAGAHIYGSVSTSDIAAAIKRTLVHDAEASRIALEAQDVAFVGYNGDKVRTVGRWDVDVTVRHSDTDRTVGKVLKPVRLKIEVIKDEDA